MRKRALCVGINHYPGTGAELQGCVNDARDWAGALRERGYAVTTLFDNEATGERLREELVRLMQDATSGDRLAFTFSGYGSWIPDTDGPPADGRDEIFCPYDVAQGRRLEDDDLSELLGRRPDGVPVFLIADTCHAGAVERFHPPRFPDAGELHPRPRYLPPEAFLDDERLLAAARSVALVRCTSRQKYPALLLAACRDAEYAWDAPIEGRPNGAFTRMALEALKEDPRTPAEWMAGIHRLLPTTLHPQMPQLLGRRKARHGPMP